MSTSLVRRYTFSAAHHLSVGDNHKCSRIHGHNYDAEIRMTRIDGGGVDRGFGWVADTGDIDQAINPILDLYYDHRDLNETLGEPNPTVEILARRIFEHAASAVVSLRLTVLSVSVSEGSRTTGIFNG